jgi:hypothetical protein
MTEHRLRVMSQLAPIDENKKCYPKTPRTIKMPLTVTRRRLMGHRETNSQLDDEKLPISLDIWSEDPVPQRKFFLIHVYYQTGWPVPDIEGQRCETDSQWLK